MSGDDLPYAGVAGRTRSETVQVLLPDGAIRSLSVFVGVDAVADPTLATLARLGTLHQVADGVDLAIPFTYHDPLARLFVLVIPEALRHRVLAQRAELMLAIASDTRHAVPDYVRDVEVVIGARGLLRRLDTRVPEPQLLADETTAYARALAAREAELDRRERLVEARELALRNAPTIPGLHAVRESDVEEIDDADDDAAYEAVLVSDNDGTERDDGSALIEEVEEIEAGEVEDIDAPADFRGLFMAVPDAFTIDPALPLWLTESNGRVWLFVRGRPGTRHGDGELELLVQLDPAISPPVVLVSLVFDVGGSPEVRRGVIDPFVPEQSRALYLLAQHFEVELVAVSAHGMEHFATLHTPREGNVRAILALLERHGEIDLGRWLEARATLLAAPPPWRDRTHPFQSGSGPDAPLTATEAAVLLDDLTDWLSPERQARVRLTLCVPDDVVDATYRAGIGYALDWGLSLTREMAAKALELGIEKDEAALLLRRIDGLCRTCREADLGGMEQGVLRTEWSEALEQAARLGVTLTDEARELALKHAGERALVHANALSDARDASLDPERERAQQDPPDPEALEVLVTRGGYRDVLAACRVAHRLAPEAAGALFAKLARRVDPIAVDALLSLLSSPEHLMVRAGAALALASRRALNALDDLVSHVGREADPAYRVFALALGRYGAGSFRAIARALRRFEVAPERAALVYAHLALHGARAQVRAKARARDPRDVQLAERALALASQMKGGEKPALGLEQQGSLTVFCEMFDRLCRDTVG